MSANLLSLRNIAKQMTQTQQILSTGMKVNSAIDNASSYYQAQSLNNRSADLNSLLEAMGQGIQTINAAVEGINNALKYLEQAKVVAEQALGVPEIEYDPDIPSGAEEIKSKKDFQNLMSDYGIGGVVVSTKTELIAAIEAAKTGGDQDIIIWGSIDMGNTAISLADGVNLVAGKTIINDNGLHDVFYVGKSGNAQLSFNNNGSFDGAEAAITVGQGTTIADLTFNYSSYAKQALIYVDKKTATLSNLTINVNSVKTTGITIGAIELSNAKESRVEMRGKNEVALSGNTISWNAVRGGWNSQFELEEDAVLTTDNINVTNGGNNVIRGVINAIGAATLATNPSNFEVYGTVHLFIGSNTNSMLTTVSELKIKNGGTLHFVDDLDKNPVFIDSGRKIIAEAGATVVYTDTLANSMTIWTAQKNGTVTGPINFTGNTTLADYPDLWSVQVKPSVDPSNSRDMEDSQKGKMIPDAEKIAIYKKQYDQIMAEYDKLISDASYGGVNLLAGDKLKVKFNAAGSSFFEVVGTDISTEKLGFKHKSWLVAENIEAISEQVGTAINELRHLSGNFSNMYSIVTTRENFTQQMSDVLTEGADKLLLADMNEASAEYLMLEIRQSLAVNALSLAAQSNQSIMQIF